MGSPGVLSRPTAIARLTALHALVGETLQAMLLVYQADTAVALETLKQALFLDGCLWDKSGLCSLAVPTSLVSAFAAGTALAVEMMKGALSLYNHLCDIRSPCSSLAL